MVTVQPLARVNRRSAHARDAVLRVTADLLIDGGLPAVNVDAVSALAGVSKATIYRHWPNRVAIAVDAFAERLALDLPLHTAGTAADNLTAQLHAIGEFYRSPAGRVFIQLLGAGTTDPDTAARLRDRFFTQRRALTAQLWTAGQHAGEVRSDVDADTAIDLLFGALVFRLIAGHAPLDRAALDAVADAALHGLLRPAAPAAPRVGG